MSSLVLSDSNTVSKIFHSRGDCIAIQSNFTSAHTISFQSLMFTHVKYFRLLSYPPFVIILLNYIHSTFLWLPFFFFSLTKQNKRKKPRQTKQKNPRNQNPNNLPRSVVILLFPELATEAHKQMDLAGGGFLNQSEFIQKH